MARQQKFEDFDLYIFDIEGVLLDDIDNPKRYNDAFRLVDALKKANKTVVCLSNVGRKSRRQVLKSLLSLGYPFDKQHVFSAGAIAASYFKKNHESARIFLISEGGVLEDFKDMGLNVVDNPPVDFVVVAADRTVTYSQLNFAANMLLQGAKLVGVGGGFFFEGTYLGIKGKFLGEDAFVYMLSKATGVEPLFIGKPHSIVYDVLMSVFNTEPEKTVMIGDKIETDVIGAKNAGLYSVLINRGRYTKEQLLNLRPNEKPDLIVQTLNDLIKQ